MEHPKAGQKHDGKNDAENGKLDPTSDAASRQSIWTSFTTALVVVSFASFKPLFIHGGGGGGEGFREKNRYFSLHSHVQVSGLQANILSTIATIKSFEKAVTFRSSLDSEQLSSMAMSINYTAS